MNPANDATPIQRTISVPFQPGPDGAAGAVGSALADTAERGVDFGVQMMRAQQQASLVSARNVATKQLDDLSDQFRTDPDPTTAPDRYAAAAQKIGDAITGTLQGRAAQEFQGDFGQMAESRRVAVKDMAFNRQVQSAHANLDDTIETQSRVAAFAPNPAVRASAIDTISKGVNGLVETGMLSAEEGERKMQTARERLAMYDGKNAVFSDPTTAQKQLANPNYLPDLDPIVRVELQHSAESEMHVREREARQDGAMARMQASQDAGALHDVIASGLPVAQEVMDAAENSARASGDPRAQARFVGLLKAKQFADSFRGASTQDLIGGLAGIETQANKTGANEAMATATMAIHKRIETQQTALAHDPLMWANDQGVTQIAPLALNGTDAPGAFAARMKQAQLVSQHYGVPVAPLTQSESELLKTQLLEQQDPNMRLATLQTVVRGFGPGAPQVLKQIGAADPAITNAGTLVASGPAYAGSARDVLTGAQLLGSKANENLRPSPTGVAASGANSLLSAYAMIPGSRTPVLAGADAIYAAQAARLGLAGGDVVNSSKGRALYNQALQQAAGARFDGDGTQWGGIGSYRGNSTLVPGNIKVDDFEDLVHHFRPADLAAASVTRAPPTWEGGDAPDNLIHRTWLVSGGNGRYGLSATDPTKGAITPVMDKSGHPFRFDFNTALIAMQARTRKGAN